ncbi:MAG: hypothetical protein ABI162_19755 [Luteolibacter sp.]
MHLVCSLRVFAVATSLFLTSQSGRAQATAAEFIAKGDVCDVACRPGEALKNYLPAEKLDPNNVALLLRISRQYRHMMTDAGNVGEKLKFGNIALAYDKKSVALAPNDSDAQLSPAITYGKMLPFEGKKEQVAASPLIKAAADRAIKLNPRNDNAWHVLGRWHQSLANVTGLKRALGEMLYGKLPVGSYAESIKCFNKAIAINPNRLRHYVELGHTYALLDEPKTARRFLEKGLAMPSVEKDDPDMKALGRETLAKLP